MVRLVRLPFVHFYKRLPIGLAAFAQYSRAEELLMTVNQEHIHKLL
jgi:hypothetical protein